MVTPATETLKTDTAKDGGENGSLNILGQSWRFPKTIPGTVSMCFLCAAAVALAYVILHAPKEQLRTIVGFAFLHVDPDGSGREKERDTVTYGFFTPSPDTAKVLQQSGEVVPEDRKWLLNKVEDADLIKFGDALRDASGVEGYRRSAIWGQGRKVDDKKTPAIPGYWWTVRAKKSFTVEELSKLYNNHWQNKNPLYIEVFDPSGTFK